MSLKVIKNKVYINDKEIAAFVDNEDMVLSYQFHNHISFSEIAFLIDEDFPTNVTFYGILKGFYIEIRNENNCCEISFSYYLADPFEWLEDITYGDFFEKFNLVIKENEIYDVEVIDTDDSSIIVNAKLFNKCAIGDFYKKLITFFNTQKNQILLSNKVSKAITFSSEHLTAGISILQYFGKLLQERYPNEKVSVSIKQEDLKVTMIVETPDGKKEEIEEYLNRYGLVISNQITPQEFTSNTIQILELETKLESAKVEIGFQKKLLALKDKTYDKNLVSLKDEVKFLRNELSSIQTSNNEQIKLLLSSLLIKDKLIKKLTKSIDKKDSLETKQLLLELKDKDNNGYIGLKQHLDNAMIGSIVNAPSWIQFTMGIITKL